ncbi:nucleotidyltransferase domain-containing protein [Paenibacillus sp. MMS18-CY102]|uniref:nucleotidyltransferase domain-containing protein n=1 Tax=Paenibacillus sp. MMS18-CY102 TaxID=2682849 RepID=UPI001365C192|nr:nucleotidyltransferase domain-containing protein [Paenibacillus sp. MMS18-CY102]MWC27702.1 nucleotidyltransferase domain-containing protein [Paenibacillus sp. MMS18-CY102]
MTEHNKIKGQIVEELQRIEQEENVRILYACESGSRAWGFPSKDSDYDVRFIYVRTMESYLSIYDKRDVIERPISDLLDISGWDLKKALLLLRKSNPPLLEWLQSPIPYMESYSVAEQIRSLSPLSFSPRSCMYHYLHMARGNYRAYLKDEQVKIKKYFYVLRPILACEWIGKYNTMPPIAFQSLVGEFMLAGSELSAAIDHLLARKMAGDELDYGPRIEPINDYVEERLDYYERIAPGVSASMSEQNDDLDALFRAALTEAWRMA